VSWRKPEDQRRLLARMGDYERDRYVDGELVEPVPGPAFDSRAATGGATTLYFGPRFTNNLEQLADAWP
jgi:hypothetical protein